MTLMLIASFFWVAEVATNNQEMWAFLVGALLPPFIAIVQQPRWPDWLRAVVTVISCIAVATVTVYLTSDNLDLNKELVGVILRVLIAAQATYVAFWKKTRVVPEIEAKTSPSTSPPPPQ